MSWVETVATAFGVLSVAFYIARSAWSWPTGLAQVALSVFAFHEVKLYSDMVLQIVFVPIQAYGWWYWLYGDPNRAEPPITRMSARAAGGWAAAAVALTLALGYFMGATFGAAMPYPDAAIAVLSLIAQYLLARKVLENWAIWIAVDVLAEYVYASKGLYLFTGLYAAFLLMATGGLIAWIAAYRRQPPPASERGFEAIVARA
jgi:nicotinamide mononucleotide transporter